MAKKKILLLLGPNLDMVGVREQGIYGTETAESINRELQQFAQSIGFELTIYQSNHEGDLIDQIHAVRGCYDGCILNAGALTHYSYALRDAIASVHEVPFIETHMSNIYAREDFRHISVLAPVCAGQISGFGKTSYYLAMYALKEML